MVAVETAKPQQAVLKTALAVLVGLLVLYIGLRWAGEAQQGNFLAFFGSLVMVIPSARLMVDNWPFHQAAKAKADDRVLRSIQVKIGEAQVQNYVRFSWVDAICYLTGTLLLAAGFLLQVLGWSLPV